MKMEFIIQLIEKDEVSNIYKEIKHHTQLFDGTLGTYGDALCKSCSHSNCNGHTGFIKLDFIMPHPIYVTLIPKIVSCFCINCRSLCKPNIKATNFSDYYEMIISKSFNLQCECSDPQTLIFKYETTYNNNTKEFMFDKKSITGFSMKNKGHHIASYTIDEVYELFDLLTEEDVKLLGFASNFKPKNLLINYVPVLMNVARSGLVADGHVDYLTRIYQDILTETQKETLNEPIKLQIFNLFSTIIGKKADSDGLQMIRHMLSGKTGLMRSNLMSARQNRSARTVISLDTSIPITHVGVPRRFKKKLTVFHYVTNTKQYIDYILSDEFVNNGNINIKKPLNKFNAKALPKILAKYSNGNYYTERELRDDDWVYINRQPTLHRNSFLAFKTRLINYGTITLNLACVAAFNADFDGDEMTLYVASDKDSIKECEERMAIEHNMISAENNSLVVRPAQDSIAAVYMMTRDNVEFDDEERKFFGRNTSHSLFWSLLPADYKCDKQFPIKRGALEEIIIEIINKINPKAALETIDKIQLMADNWMQVFPLSIGYFDFAMLTEDERKDIMDAMYENDKPKIIAAEKAKEDFPEYVNDLEKHISMFLDINIKMGISKVLQLETRKDNPLVSIVLSGSKGKDLDIVQGTVALCQQYFNGRQKPMIGIPKDSIDPEDKGFVTSSYSKGLTQKELFYQATAARATIVSTGVNTADPGYLQRQLSRFMADVYTDSDGNVINHLNMKIARGKE